MKIIPIFEWILENFENFLECCKNNTDIQYEGPIFEILNDTSHPDNSWFENKVYKRLQQAHIGFYLYRTKNYDNWLHYGLYQLYYGFLEYSGYKKFKKDDLDGVFFEDDLKTKKNGIQKCDFTLHEKLGLIFE